MEKFNILFFNQERIGHPIYSALTTRFKIDFAVDANQDSSAYKLIMAHGKASDYSSILSPDRFSEIMDSGAGVLVLDPDINAMNMIIQNTGMGTKNIPYAYFICKESDTHFRVFEIEYYDMSGKFEQKSFVAEGDKIVLSSELTEEKDIIIHSDPDRSEFISTYINNVLEYLFANQSRLELGKSEEQNDIPTDIKKWSFTVTSKIIYYIGDFDQWVTGTRDYHVFLFLNNPADGEQYQYIYIRHDSRINPGELISDAWTARGWFQDKIETSFEIKHDKIVLDQSSPANTASVVDVTDSVSFNIAYELSKEPKHTGSFEYSHSETRSIKDWQIIENTTQNKASWIYAQQLPYNALNDDFASGLEWMWYTVSMYKVKDLPILSKYTLQTDTQAVWRTKEVLDEVVTCEAKLFPRQMYFDTGFLAMYPFYRRIDPSSHKIEILIDLGKVTNT